MFTDSVSCACIPLVNDTCVRMSALCCVVFDLNHRILIDAVMELIQINAMCA